MLPAAFLAACAAAPTRPAATASAPAGLAASQTITPPATETATPRPPAPSRTPTQTPSPTATFPVAQACLPLAAVEPLAQTDFSELPTLIQSFLNSGGGLDALERSLTAIYAANPPRPVAQADLNGDGVAETVVSVVDAQVFADPKPGALLLYNCEAGAYRLVQMEFPAAGFGAPRIVHIQDINADGLNELIVSSATCGASACFEDARILGWDGVQYRNLLEGSTAELPFPDLQITDFDRDGVFDLEAASNGIGSVGAGPQRPIIRHYAFDPTVGKWLLNFETLGASTFRVHVLHDAEAALHAGDTAVAAVLYQEVIVDDGLADWIDPGRERPVLAAYAGYKLVVIAALNGDVDAAAAALKTLTAAHPTNTGGHPYVEMATAFVQGFLAGDVADGCLAAQTYAATHVEQILLPLGPMVYGYTNPEISLLDVCP